MVILGIAAVLVGLAFVVVLCAFVAGARADAQVADLNE